MKTIDVPDNKLFDWLYYETGFEQLHPNIEIIEWMQDQGYTYQTDWFCKLQARYSNMYKLEFPTEYAAVLFLLRWS